MRRSFLYLALSLLLCIQPDIQAGLLHRYSFTNGDSGAVDSISGQNGTLQGGATISGNAVQLDGANDYVNLPSNLITSFTSVTFEAWFTCAAANGTWSRIWDFGDTNPTSGAGRDYVFFTPKSGSNTFRYAISDADPGYNNENMVETTPTATGVPVYVACVHNSSTGAVKLYVNGQLASSGTFSIPLSSVNNVFSYLGRSLYPDPYLKGSIDEFRIYNSILTPEEITQHYNDGPDVVGPSPIVIQETGGSTEVTEGNNTPDTYTVALSSQPDSNVTLTVDPDEQLDIGNGRGNLVRIDFTTQNWNVGQTVTVRAYDDDVFEADPHIGIISHSISSNDPNFNNKFLPSVRVNVWDNECGAWGYNYADLNCDCNVNFEDFVIFASYWLSSFNPITLETVSLEWLKTTQPYVPNAQHGPVPDSPDQLFIEPNEIICQIDEKVYGHFLEHIYHSVNGGLWGELVWNRSFEQYSGGLGTHWTSYGTGTFTISSNNPKNSSYRQKIISSGTETGIQQTPFFIENGQTYRGSLWALSTTAPCSLVVRLKNGSTTIQEQAITTSSSNNVWIEYPFTFTPNQSAENATLQVGVTGTETVYLDQVSMMGQDANATGGYRPDLLQAVEDLHPPVIRWPGGCFASAYFWKDGIGTQVQRVSYPIVLWDDKDVDSYGTDEFIQMCHAMGTEPIIVINTGILNSTCGVSIPNKKTSEEYLADAVDWVEYCNGPASSTWGAVRAENGHPEPYNVKYWEIDNETWAAGSAAYCVKVQAFAPAMKAVDPTIKIIACGGSGYDQSWNQDVINACATIIDYISIHHYESAGNYQSGPPSFEAHIEELGNIIAASSNPNIKIDMSEWNAQSTDWRTGLYAGGMLNGFERNCDVFKIGGPALFLRHTSATAWDNAFINFDHTGWFPAPNYVVMKLWRDSFAPYRINMTGPVGNLNAIATRSADGSKIYFKVVNPTDQGVPIKLVISDTFDVGSVSLQLVAPDSLSARNTLDDPNAVRVEDGYAGLNNQTIRFAMPRLSAGVVKVSRKE